MLIMKSKRISPIPTTGVIDAHLYRIRGPGAPMFTPTWKPPLTLSTRIRAPSL
jgi:hypothetical protein